MFMLRKKNNKVKRPIDSKRAFPWRCRHCGQDQVFLSLTSYDAEVRHDGSLYAFKIPSLKIPICRACGEKVFTEKVDSQITAGLRSHLRLLTPDPLRRSIPNARFPKSCSGPTNAKTALRRFCFAGPRGIEPRLSVLETDVLPLNYGPR